MTDTDIAYALWFSELKTPTDPERRGDRSHDAAVLSGFWRAVAAKTKPDYPVAIWAGDEGKILFQIGRKLRNTIEHEAEWNDFAESTWLHCIAVRENDYHNAVLGGFWPDGKPARQMDTAERMGIDVKSGDNRAPVDETIEEQIAAAVAKADAIVAVTSEADARVANELAEKLAVLFKMGDAERVKEKTPFDEGAKAVQAKWLPIINPATDARTRVIALTKAWLKAEQKRIDDAAAEERRKRQAEVDAENERIRAENAKRMEEADQSGKDVDLQPEVAAAPVEAPKAKAASTYGRSTGLRKVTRAKIIDIEKLLIALATHKEMVEFAQTLANRAAKAGIPLDGMEIEETME